MPKATCVLLLLFATAITPGTSFADAIDALANKVSTHPTAQQAIYTGNAIVSAKITGVAIQPTYTIRRLSISGDKTSYPTTIRSESFEARNCSPRKREFSQSFEMSVDIGVEISVTTAADIRDDVKTSFGTGGDVPFNVNRETARSISFSITQNKTERKTTSEKRTWSETREMPAATLLRMKADRKIFKDSYPFEAEVVISGTATVYSHATVLAPRVGMVTVDGYPVQLNLSQLFPNEADRLVKASGRLTNSFSDDIKLSYGEIKLNPKDPKICPENFTNTGDQGRPIVARQDAVELQKEGESKPESLDEYASVQKDVLTLAIPNDDQAQQVIRQFFARGEHTCQSESSLGHRCEVRGTGYFDCNQAFYGLKRKSCCAATKQGGSSTGFELTKCSSHTP